MSSLWQQPPSQMLRSDCLFVFDLGINVICLNVWNLLTLKSDGNAHFQLKGVGKVSLPEDIK